MSIQGRNEFASKKVIFVTGATGCIGRYTLDLLVKMPNVEIHLLVRDPLKVPKEIHQYQYVFVHQGDLSIIQKQSHVLKRVTHVIHLATAWGDSEEASALNRDKTLEMLSLCDPHCLERIVYFSTASILSEDNRPMPECDTLGTGYIRSKYRAYVALKNSPLADKIVTIFPTFVFGGDSQHPYSHISEGLLPHASFAKWLRFVYLDATFHFMHARDIATMTLYALQSKQVAADVVVGQRVCTGKQALQILCRWAGYRVWFQLKIPPSLLVLLARLLRIRLSSWDQFCISHPFFKYQVLNPESIGAISAFPTLHCLLDDIRQSK